MDIARSQESVLEEIVKRLVPAVDPQRVILFGSRASGHAAPHSDYDILIVRDSTEPKFRNLARARQALYGIGVPIDLLWYSPQEIEYWAEVTTHVASQASQNGRLIYDKAA